MADIFNKSTGGIHTCWNMVQYRKEAVQAAIDRDKTITRKQAKLIHALLKGRQA